MGKMMTNDPETILSSIHNGIISIDSKGIISYFNKTAERLFKMGAHEAVSRHVRNVLPEIGQKFLLCLETGKPYYGEKIKEKDVTLICNINPVIGGGRVSGVVGVFQDISEIEGIVKELDSFRVMKNWLDTVIDSSYDGLWICDHEGKVLRINKSSERINGIKAEQVVGRNMRELVAEGLFDRSVTLEVLKRKTAVTIMQQIKGGKKVLVTGNPVFNEKREIRFVVTNDRDISELNQLRDQLQKAQALAKGYSTKISELEMQGIDLSYLIYRSQEMQRVVEMALRVAQVDTTVLLLGESGVGKGMIAKLIHKQSQRSRGPFIRVDLAGIPDSLVESELFGYEKGAFTGARAEGKIGFCELANCGTLFLDEVAEIPLSSQSKILRFLEEHEIIRVGGTILKELDVRVLAATNKNIEEMVSSKLFREDLYYRINVVPIHIPPLRERREDIVPLIYFFLDKFNKAHKKTIELSNEAVATLCDYDFPGNIRELANLIERIVVVCDVKRVDNKDLLGFVIGSKTEVSKCSHLPTSPLKDAVREYEASLIRNALKKYGSQRTVAKLFKVHQATISRKIRRQST